MPARDIFTRRSFGRSPSLKDLLLDLPISVASALLGGVQLTGNREKIIDGAIRDLSDVQRKEMFRRADLILHGSQIEKEDLEELARTKSIVFSKRESAHEIVSRLINTLGIKATEQALAAILVPTEHSTGGSFAEFNAPPLDINATDAEVVKWANQLEDRMEVLLSAGAKETKHVKVRIERDPEKILFVMYYQRSDVDGKDVERVSKVKKIVPKTFKRGAGTTYFIIKGGKRHSRIVFRGPDRQPSRSLRIALGHVLWQDPAAISEQPATVHDLSVFKKLDFALSVEATEHNIEKITLSEIGVRVLSGNVLLLKAAGRDGDALADFREISRGADVFVEQSTVECVSIKFLPKGDRRKVLAKAKVYPNKIELDDDEDWVLVNTHLKAWGIISD